MIIGVKATKSEEPEVDLQERYRLPEEKRSNRPKYLAILLAGIALYLKSIFPSSPPEANERTDPDADQPTTEPAADGIDAETVASLNSSETASTSDTESDLDMPGSSGKLISSYGAKNSYPMIEVELPELNFSARDFIGNFGPTSISLRAANDNPVDSFGGSGQNTPGAAGSGQSAGEDEPNAPDYDDENPQQPDDEEDHDNQSNRAPRNTGPVQLYDVTGCAAILIAMAQLLRNTIDPDGDALSIRNLTISSGSLTMTPSGWLFEPGDLGPVTLTYQVTDGEFSVWQSAYFSVERAKTITGTSGSDILIGTECADNIDGAACDDNIDARGGNDTINGGTGNDNIVAGAGNDTVFAGAGNDVVMGGQGNDWISGGSGNDRLFGDDGNDTVFGDEGDDQIHGGEGDDLVFGSHGDDVLAGDGGNDLLDGGEGNDKSNGGAGNDRLFGREGMDTLKGDAGDDVLSGGAQSDIVQGNMGNDTVIGDADGVNDVYSGDEGIDTIDYSALASSVAIDICNESAQGDEIGNDTISGFEIIKGGSGDDEITGGQLAEDLHGNGGDDVIADGGGCDRVEAGSGDDTVLAAADSADDNFLGQAGIDTISYAQAGSGVLIDMANGTATGVTIGNDTIAGFEHAIGGSGNDHLIASGNTISLRGGDGQDIFEFNTPSQGADIIHEILDFMVGDRIRISQYDLLEEVIDTLEDRFEDIYGDDDDDDFPIRIRHEQTDDMSRTLIEADLDRDGHRELTIGLEGHHIFMFVENA